MKKELKKSNKKELGSIIILSLTIMILFSVLGFILQVVVGYQTLFHNQKMEELELKKEIALINNLEYNSNLTARLDVHETILTNNLKTDEIHNGIFKSHNIIFDTLLNITRKRLEENNKKNNSLNGLHNCLYYESIENVFLESSCYIVNRYGEVLR